MEPDMLSETIGFHPQLTWLSAREEIIEFSHHENFKSYNKQNTSIYGLLLQLYFQK
jgi:hypothetical protein